MTYSSDFRRKVLSVREREGLTIAEVASRFCVGVASVVRWLKHPDPKSTRNKPATKIDMEALARDVLEHPDAYQYERAKRLGVSEKGIGHALRRMGVSYKKSLHHPKANGGARRVFQAIISAYEHEKRPISMKADLLMICHARMVILLSEQGVMACVIGRPRGGQTLLAL